MKNATIICSLFLGFYIFNLNAQTVINESPNTSFQFLEGPVWDGQEFIYFTDIPNNSIIKFSVTQKTFTTVLAQSERSNGLMFDMANNLIVCEGGTGKIQKRSIDGNLIETITESFNNSRYNTTNDLCIDKKGGIYFTDPIFGNNAIQYQPKFGVYYVSPGTGNVLLVVDDMEKPNGVLLSTDGKTLYVNDSWNQFVRSYDVQDDGTITNQKTFATLQLPAGEEKITGADGMATDTAGNLYVTTAIGVQVFDKNGNATQTIAVPEKPTNCTFGGVNNNILYITAGKNLYSIQLPVTGFRHPFDLTDTNLSIDGYTPDGSDAITYPNPVKEGFVTINTKGFNTTNTAVTLYDLQGKKIDSPKFSKAISSLEVQLKPSLAKGTYLIELENESNTQAVKILVE